MALTSAVCNATPIVKPPVADASPEHAARGQSEARLAVVMRLWAIATLFHTLGYSGRAAAFLEEPNWTGVSHLGLAAAAVWLLRAPCHMVALGSVGAGGLLTAWLESPAVGSHWVLAALINATMLSAMAFAHRGHQIDRNRLDELVPTVCVTVLVVFYACAAFAKLNSAFLDPAVSCATRFADQVVQSLLPGRNRLSTMPAIITVTPIAVTTIEVIIPILLLIPGSRLVGAAVGILFHSTIGLNRIHLFSDFSAVLIPLFVLCLPGGFFGAANRWLLTSRGRRLVDAWIVAVLIVLLCQVLAGWRLPRIVFVEGRLWLWYWYDASVVLGLFWYLRRLSVTREGAASMRLAWAFVPRSLVGIPLATVAIGVLPYLELRTAGSFTMYANLRIVDGMSNHLLIRHGLPLGRRHAARVRILWSDDTGLAGYRTSGYDLPWDSLRAYMARHPYATVRFESNGVVSEVSGAQLARPDGLPLIILNKLFPLRAVDRHTPARCQESYLPAG